MYHGLNVKIKEFKFSFNKEDVKNLLRYHIENFYIKLRGQIYKQNTGVPMAVIVYHF